MNVSSCWDNAAVGWTAGVAGLAVAATPGTVIAANRAAPPSSPEAREIILVTVLPRFGIVTVPDYPGLRGKNPSSTERGRWITRSPVVRNASGTPGGPSRTRLPARPAARQRGILVVAEFVGGSRAT
ncbi:hypothetical protein GCM10025787_29100 [Saccharopolyspora rosea]